MAKFYLDCDERYPDYSLDQAEGCWKAKEPRYRTVEVSDELFERYRNAVREYDIVQSLLGDLEED